MARTLANYRQAAGLRTTSASASLPRFFPAEKIHEVLEQTRRSVRERDLPAHVVVYYVIALALYRHAVLP